MKPSSGRREAKPHYPTRKYGAVRVPCAVRGAVRGARCDRRKRRPSWPYTMITFLLLDYHKPTRPSLTFYRLPPPRALVNFHCLPCFASYAVLVPGPGEPASDVVSVLVLAIRESRAGAFKLSCGKGAGGRA